MKQAYLVEVIEARPKTHFMPDQHKEGGCYITVTKSIKRIDEQNRVIFLTDRSCIAMDDIIAIESEILPEIV